jgi:hypothetical protein
MGPCGGDPISPLSCLGVDVMDIWLLIHLVIVIFVVFATSCVFFWVCLYALVKVGWLKVDAKNIELDTLLRARNFRKLFRR